jgi:hypothetical protein
MSNTPLIEPHVHSVQSDTRALHLVQAGKVSTAEAAAVDSEYVAELCDGILVDAEKQGTEARFINDFHVSGNSVGQHFHDSFSPPAVSCVCICRLLG